MNQCIVVGRVHKWPGEIKTYNNGAGRLLACIVSYEKTFPSGKKFNVQFKVAMFGKAIDQVAPRLGVGTLVAVSGEVSIDMPKEGGKGEPTLKIIGNITVLEQVKAAADAPTEEDDSIPF